MKVSSTDRSKFLQKPLHPFLFALIPIVYLIANNRGGYQVGDPLRSIFFSLLLTCFLWAGFWLVLKDGSKSALLATLFLVLFFSYGHVVNFLNTYNRNPLDLSEMLRLGWLWILIFLVLTFLILRQHRSHTAALFLNLMGLIFLLFNIATLVQAIIIANQQIPREQELLARLRGSYPDNLQASDQTARPDIYFIILDSYERADKLAEYYQMDNSAFIVALRQRGFFVADQSRSNYLTTLYSLPATLNMVYLNELPARLFTRMTSSLQVNYTRDYLKSAGYRVVIFESGYTPTEKFGADVVCASTAVQDQKIVMNPFEIMLLQTTMGNLLFENYIPTEQIPQNIVMDGMSSEFAARRQRIQYAFDHLADSAADEESFYVFAHILSPHNPYLWNADGKELVYNGSNALLGDKTNPQQNIQYYNDQLRYDNQMALAAIDRILANSATPPVIILQADHGHDTFFEWDAITEKGADLRSAILTAYYFPDGDYAQLYPSISPVNTFRVTFNHIFDTDYPLLPDHTYLYGDPRTLPPGSMPDFEDICTRYSQICLGE
jgi:hypothetical protein